MKHYMMADGNIACGAEKEGSDFTYNYEKSDCPLCVHSMRVTEIPPKAAKTIEELLSLRERIIQQREKFEKLVISANDAKAAMEQAASVYDIDARFYRAEVAKVFGVAYLSEDKE